MQIDGLSNRYTHEIIETVVRTNRRTPCLVSSGKKKTLQCWVHHICIRSLFIPIAQHVDDMIGGGDETDEVYLQARESLKKEFNFKYWTTEGKGELEFCGNKLITCENGAWKLQQEKYMKKIRKMYEKDQTNDNHNKEARR